MAYRMAMSISNINPLAIPGTTVPTAVSPTAVSPTAGGACSMAYGPVANICQSSVPVTQMVPVTRVTPIPNTVQPQVSVGQPMGVSPWGKGTSPFGVPQGLSPFGIPQGISPFPGIAPMGAVPGLGSMSKSMGPWGATNQATTGIVPGMYTDGTAMVW